MTDTDTKDTFREEAEKQIYEYMGVPNLKDIRDLPYSEQTILMLLIDERTRALRAEAELKQAESEQSYGDNALQYWKHKAERLTAELEIERTSNKTLDDALERAEDERRDYADLLSASVSKEYHDSIVKTLSLLMADKDSAHKRLLDAAQRVREAAGKEGWPFGPGELADAIVNLGNILKQETHT